MKMLHEEKNQQSLMTQSNTKYLKWIYSSNKVDSHTKSWAIYLQNVIICIEEIDLLQFKVVRIK